MTSEVACHGQTFTGLKENINTREEDLSRVDPDLGNQVTEDQVHNRYGPVIASGARFLWEHARELVRTYFGKQAK
jgi:hypothetical protein